MASFFDDEADGFVEPALLVAGFDLVGIFWPKFSFVCLDDFSVSSMIIFRLLAMVLKNL